MWSRMVRTVASVASPPSASRAALILLGCLSMMGGVAAQVPVNSLMVQLQMNELIVDHGLVNPAWAPPPLGGPYPLTQVDFPRYTIYLDVNTTTQDFVLTYKSTDLTVLTTSSSTESGTASSAHVQSTTKTQCVGAGTAKVMVSMSFNNPTAPTISWQYTKTCIAPLIQVGLRPWGSDVADSVPTGVPVEASTFANYVLTENTLQLYFVLANPVADGVIAPFSLSVTSSNVHALTIASATYNASWGPGGDVDKFNYAILDVSQPLSVMTIQFTCGDKPTSQTPANILIDYNWVNPLKLTVTKQCYTAPVLIDLDIGSLSNLSVGGDIVSGGTVNQQWSGSKGHIFTADEIFQYVFDFFLCIGCRAGANGPNNVPFNVTYDNQASAVYNIHFGDVNSIGSGVLTTGNVVPFRAYLECYANGTGTTFWQVDFGPSLELMEFAFTYTCVFPFLDLRYGAATDAAGGMAVAKDSHILPAFDTFTVTIPASETTSKFYFYLDSIDQYRLLPHQFYAIGFFFDPSAMSAPVVYDPNYGSAPLLHPNYEPIQITWQCLKTDHVAVTMSFRFGWNRNIDVRFFKDCGPSSDDNGGGGGSGWSGAGIFFFVLFLIFLASFVAGTAWNYKEGKRGWEMIPLYTNCVKCVDSTKGGNNQHWTPQMDTASGSNNKASYGNFDDTADGYQSNL